MTAFPRPLSPRMKAAAALPLLCLLAGLPTAADAKVSLGIYDGWGAFRTEEGTARCYAIAEPSARTGGSDWQAYASIGYWPTRAVRGQLYFRLSKEKREGASVTLSIGEQKFALVSGGANAWAADAKMDAAIISALRSATSMTVSVPAKKGVVVADTYRLRGAASAIDAAALGCAR